MQQGAALLSLDETTPQMLHEAITDKRAWKRETLSPEDWLVPFPAGVLWELDAVVQYLRQYPQPVAHLRLASFKLTACASIMAQACEDALPRGFRRGGSRARRALQRSRTAHRVVTRLAPGASGGPEVGWDPV